MAAYAGVDHMPKPVTTWKEDDKFLCETVPALLKHPSDDFKHVKHYPFVRSADEIPAVLAVENGGNPVVADFTVPDFAWNDKRQLLHSTPEEPFKLPAEVNVAYILGESTRRYTTHSRPAGRKET
jgi:hypothetical protein